MSITFGASGQHNLDGIPIISTLEGLDWRLIQTKLQITGFRVSEV